MELVGLKEFAEILEWDKSRLSTKYSRQRIGRNVRFPLPEPIQILAATPVWTLKQAMKYKESIISVVELDAHDPLDEPIELLDLPTKIYRLLKNNWFSKVNTVRELTETDLSKVRGLGPSSTQIIEEALENYLK